MLVETVIGLALLLGVLYFYFTRRYDYWKKKGVVFIKPQFPFGFPQDAFLGKRDNGKILQEYYTEYKAKGLKYVGAFLISEPTLVVLDLDLAKQILVKDFHHFMAREMAPITHEYISKHLFAMEGAEWKEMRTKLTPTFTSGKIRNMFVLMENCAKQLQDHVEENVLVEGEFEVKDLIARFTTDIIATCAFGLDVNSIKERDHFFFEAGQLIFRSTWTTIPKLFLLENFPITSRALKIKFYSDKMAHILKKVMEDTVEYRKKNSVTRNDFVDMLIKINENKSLDDDDEVKDEKNGKESGGSRLAKLMHTGGSHVKHSNEDHLTLEEMTGQAFVFFAAGFETAASTTSFCMYELAKNPDVQTKLRNEVDEMMERNGGKITYQALQEMTYMDQVVNETLRMYASLPFLTRKCTERYELPGSGVVLEKGVRVHIPTYAIHHDPDIYPRPYVFDPDRFSEEESKGRHHCAFMPFGEGPRFCIGMRFGRLQVKLGLAAIISRFELRPSPSTPDKLEIDPRIVFTTVKHPYSLAITRRSDQ